MKFKILSTIISFFGVCMTLNAQEVYMPTSRGDISPMTSAVITGNKTSGKSLLTLYGAKLTSSLVLDGKRSSILLPSSSVTFYLFIPKTVNIQGWKIAKLKQKKKERELPYMKTGAYSGSKASLEDLPIATTRITDELYSIKPAMSLENGEYALVYLENAVPKYVFDFAVQDNLPPYPEVSSDVLMAEFYPTSPSNRDDVPVAETTSAKSSNIIRWFFDSDPRGTRIFYRVISNVPNEVKNTNESYMTTTPIEETKALNISGLTYENASNVVIEIKVTKRGYEEQVKRYNVRQALDQQEISGFFELVEKN